MEFIGEIKGYKFYEGDDGLVYREDDDTIIEWGTYEEFLEYK